MILNEDMAKVISKMERIIGDECYNPDSYNSYRKEYGRQYRYPVQVTDATGIWYKYRGSVYDLTPQMVGSMHYKFGTNKLYIGDALINILDFLEKRYDIDFNYLEENL